MVLLLQGTRQGTSIHGRNGNRWILDIILTPVFLFVLNLGVKGAALAAFIGQAVAAMVLGGCFWHGRMKLNGKKQSKNFFKIKDYGSIIKMGSAVALQAGICQRGSCIVKPAGGRIWRCGSSSNVCRRTVIYGIFQPFIGYGQGFQPVAGYQFGAENKRKLK